MTVAVWSCANGSKKKKWLDLKYFDTITNISSYTAMSYITISYYSNRMYLKVPVSNTSFIWTPLVSSRVSANRHGMTTIPPIIKNGRGK